MMGEMGNFGWGPGFGFGWVFMLLLWAVVIFGIVAIVKWLMGASGTNSAPKPKTALQILQERYASGEIDRDEFEQMKRDLTT